MSPAVIFRSGTIGLALCLVGGIAWGLHHRAASVSAVHEPPNKAVAVSPSKAPPVQPTGVSATDESLPDLSASAADTELLALARKAVAGSPQRAVAWAWSQRDPQLGRRLLSAVIRAWAESDPNAAVNWVLVQDPGELQVDMDAALAGAVKQPQLALAIVRGLLKFDPDDAASAGPALVAALNNDGQFQAALQFINDGPPDSRTDWTTGIFRHWGETQPQDAVKALDSITDEKLRADAFHAIADGWSAGDPSALANYATTLPDGQDRTYALGKAIDNWSLQDPAAMADWLTTSPHGVDFDQAIATLISKTDSVNRSPEVAIQWVEFISDPNLKYDSMKLVLRQWYQSNPAAARNYANNASWLDEQKRQELLKSLQNPSPDIASGDEE